MWRAWVVGVGVALGGVEAREALAEGTAAESCRLRAGSIYAQTIKSERVGEGAPAHEGDSKERVWLRLRNNTTCGIWVIAQNGAAKGDDAGLGGVRRLQDGQELVDNYEVQDARRGTEPRLHHAGPCSAHLLSGGDSVVFSVPLSIFLKGFNVSVRFSYEWEGQRPIFGTVVDHRVFFRCSDLPEDVRKTCDCPNFRAN